MKQFGVNRTMIVRYLLAEQRLEGDRMNKLAIKIGIICIN